MKIERSFLLVLFAIVCCVIAQKPPPCPNPVQCLVDPCTQNNCIKECISNYCGGCSYNCACSADNDCQSNEYCNLSSSTCSPLTIIVGEGESCGGFVFPSPQCADSLVCVSTQKYIPDIGGTCRRQCSANKDCPREQFCSFDEGVCLEDSQCLTDSDCSNPSNIFGISEIYCIYSQTIFCNLRQGGRCDVACGNSSSECTSCPGPQPGMPNILCSDGSIGGPVCSRNSNGDCAWEIRDCPAPSCDCGPPPPVALCPNNQSPSVLCQPINNNANECSWVVQCPNITSSCDCSTYPVPEIAKQCEDGSYVGATCVATPSGCSYEFQCPSSSSDCSANNVQCAHPIGGECLGVCSNNQCVLSAFDYCVLSPATVFSITLNKFVSDSQLIADLSSYSSLNSDHIYILGSTNRQFNVEFVDDKKVSASTAISTLQSNIKNGKVDGSSLEAAKVVVLSTEIGGDSSSSSSNADNHNNNNDSSSASLLIANFFVILSVCFVLF